MRPPKLNPEMIEHCRKALLRGVPHKTLGSLIGVSERTIYIWMNKGQEIVDEIESGELRRLNKKQKLYFQFFQTVKESDATFMQNQLTLIQSKARTDWKAASWLLERRFPDNFGKTESVKHLGDAKNPLQFKDVTDDMTEEELEEALKNLQAEEEELLTDDE